MTTTTTRLVLVIRYAQPDTTPSRYPNGGWFKADIVVTDDYWTIRGPEWALRLHLDQAMADNNVNDYRLGARR